MKFIDNYSFVLIRVIRVIRGQNNDIEQAIELAVAMKENNEPSTPIPDYADANVSVKVVKIIQSCTSIVDKVVWGKSSEQL